MSALVGDLSRIARAVHVDFFTAIDIRAIEEESHNSANDSRTRKNHCADFEIAEQDKWLDDDVAAFTQDNHDAGLDAEKSRGDQQDEGAVGQQLCGATEIAPRRRHFVCLSMQQLE